MKQFAGFDAGSRQNARSTNATRQPIWPEAKRSSNGTNPRTLFFLFKLGVVGFVLYSALRTVFLLGAGNPLFAVVGWWTEGAAILLFLFPRARIAGAGLVFTLLAIAAMITAMTGEIPIRFAYYVASVILIVHVERNILPRVETESPPSSWSIVD